MEVGKGLHLDWIHGVGFGFEEADGVQDSESAFLAQLCCLLRKKLRGEGCLLELGRLLVCKCCGLESVGGGVRLSEKVKH